MGTGKLACRAGNFECKKSRIVKNGQSVVLNLSERYAAAFGLAALHKVGYAVINRTGIGHSAQLFDWTNADFERTVFEYENERLEFFKMLRGDSSGIFAPPLIVSFSRSKHLVETEVNGSEYTVIERWGTKPYNVTIRGILVDMDEHVYPAEKIRQLHRFFEHNGIVKVTGAQFEDKEIDSIYIKDVSITPIEGFADTVQISLSAKAIRELHFDLINPEADV